MARELPLHGLFPRNPRPLLTVTSSPFITTLLSLKLRLQLCLCCHREKFSPLIIVLYDQTITISTAKVTAAVITGISNSEAMFSSRVYDTVRADNFKKACRIVDEKEAACLQTNYATMKTRLEKGLVRASCGPLSH